MIMGHVSLESWLLWLSSFVSSWLPVAYAGVMAGLAIWVMRNRSMPGMRWLAIAFTVTLVAGVVQRIAYAIAFPEYMVQGEFGSEFPRWVLFISGVSGLVHYACYVVIAFGFWKLCEHLARGPEGAAQMHTARSEAPEENVSDGQ